MAKKANSSGRATHPLEGKKAPAFQLQDGRGRKVALKDLVSQGTLVLYFYPKDMTTGCTKEACDFRDSSSAIRGLGALVVGISPDSLNSHQNFASKHQLNFTLLSDPDKKVAKAFGVYQKKSLYGREFMGIVRTTFVIDKAGVVRKVFPKVRVDGHARAVIEAVKELG